MNRGRVGKRIHFIAWKRFSVISTGILLHKIVRDLAVEPQQYDRAAYMGRPGHERSLSRP
jgi:hypothetical protein